MSNGDAYDAYVACACPFGQGPSTLTQYNRNLWALGQNDGCVYGCVDVDEVNQTTTMSIVDAFANQPLHSATFPWGSRLPSSVTGVGTNAFTPQAAPLRTAPSAPASNAGYTNTLNVPVQIIVSGGTISAIAISMDGGTTYDVTGLTAGAFYLAPGNLIRLTYTVAPTVFTQLPLA